MAGEESLTLGTSIQHEWTVPNGETRLYHWERFVGVLEVMMIKAALRIGSISILSVAFAQTGAAQGPPVSPLSSTVESSFSAGSSTPIRLTQTKTQSNGREVITETTEVPGMDGRMKTSLQTTTETTHPTKNSTQIKKDVFAPDANGRSQLAQTTQTEIQTSADGSTRSVADTFAPDANGRLGFSSREIQETKSTSPNVKQTDTSVFVPGINRSEVESQRLQEIERKVNSGLTQKESTRLERDGNGQWKTTEARSEEVRTSGNERVAEETVQRVNDTGALSVSEKKVTRETKSSAQQETVTELYSANTPGGLASSSGSLVLDQRVRTTTTGTGTNQQTVREVEGRKPGSPNEPLRVIERTVETMRQVGPDQWEMQREVFALDGNGRLVPVSKSAGSARGK
jgi:hypothetical protein